MAVLRVGLLALAGSGPAPERRRRRRRRFPRGQHCSVSTGLAEKSRRIRPGAGALRAPAWEVAALQMAEDAFA